MGVEKKVTIKVTCDICNRECNQNDGSISIKVNGGDGRDVGPATIDGWIYFNQPYGVSGGIVCRQCKIDWLDYYVGQLKKQNEFDRGPKTAASATGLE